MRRLWGGTFVLGAALLTACDQRGTSGTDFERMRRQPRYDTYGEGPFFPDRRAMQPPPDGTVPFGAAASSIEDASTRASARIPVPLTAAMVRHGRERYTVLCQPCHGVDGTADTAVAHSMRLRPPPSLVSGRVAALPPGVVYDAITRGYGLMPSYAYHLPAEERWAVVAYVQALRMSQGVPIETLGPDVRGRALRALGPVTLPAGGAADSGPDAARPSGGRTLP